MSNDPRDARSVEVLQKHVKKLKKQHQSRDPEALSLLRTALPDLAALSADQVGNAKDALCAAIKRLGAGGIVHSRCWAVPRQADTPAQIPPKAVQIAPSLRLSRE